MKAGSESAFQAQVCNLASYLGWHWYHAPDNRPIRTRDGRVRKQHVVPGFPDLIMLRGAEIMAVELKAQGGRISRDQNTWLARFIAAGVETHIWFPADWDEVRERLSAPIQGRVAA